MQRWVAACAAGEKPGELEFRALLPDGSVRVLSGRGELMSGAGNKPAVMAGTVQDITARKRAEEALRQKAEALRASNAELEQFNRAMVGRELRMIELKQEINELCRRLGEPPRHETDQFQTGRIPGAGSAPAPPGRGGA